MLPCQHPPKIRTNLIDALPEYVAVRPREIDVLENTVCERRIGKRFDGPHARRTDDQNLARLDVADVCSADEVHRTRFRADDERIVELTECQGPEPVRIANRDQPILREHQERERALDLR